MNNKRKIFVRVTIMIISILFLIYGTSRGEVEMVLNKAINICFECIGLG